MISPETQSSMTPEEQYEAGFAYRCEGNYALARQAFESVLVHSPGHLKARWQLALILGFEGDFDASLEALKALSFEAPGNTDIRYDFGMTLMMLGFFDEACAEFKAILLIDPEHEKAQQQLVYCG
jgi:tetratricopeptide (TPR) repeat protein